MRRKIAFCFTVVLTLLLMVLRLLTVSTSDFAIGSLNTADVLIVLSLISLVVVTVLCFSRKEHVHRPQKAWASVSGWICTFCGAVLAMSVTLDIYCWVVYNQVPPPNEYILNQMDLITLVCSMIFGLLGGLFLIAQGFCWMSRSDSNKPVLNWLSLAPVLWMWFRLARYEISYASTIDISESFFDFATLVVASLFFLQLARLTAKVGTPPKNGLVILSLCTAMISLSGAPATIFELASGEPIGSLLIAVVDTVVGLFALCIAAVQVFAAPTQDDEPAAEIPEDADDTMAWTSPAKETAPMDPPFEIDRVLPVVDDTPTDAAKTESIPAPADQMPTIDELLAEIENEQNMI